MSRDGVGSNQQVIDITQNDITIFNNKRHQAYQQELQRWIASGQINFEAEQTLDQVDAELDNLDSDCIAIESPVAGSIWKILVKQGQQVQKGEAILILESMKMEIEVNAPNAGVIQRLLKKESRKVLR